ncbi:MAG: DUF503 domain-containing protein [Acidobacteria bacterium]|nr:DUF503 domain-containing protein [Acidobacteriota bacterium]
MVVGVLRLEIHLPYAHSLKDKRQTLKKLKDRLRARFNVAVAELDHQDLWQRATLGIVSLNDSRAYLAQLLEAASEESARLLGGDLVDSYIEYLE